MAIKEYRIEQFQGIDQSMEQNALDPGDSPDACNMDTGDANLSVANGYVKHLHTPVPGSGPVRRMYIWRTLKQTRYVVVAGCERLLETSISAVDGNRVLTIAHDISDEVKTHLLQTGVRIGDGYHAVSSVDQVSRQLTLSQAPASAIEIDTPLVIGENMSIYACTEPDADWKRVFTYPASVQGTLWSILEVKIGDADCLLFACGEHQLIKWDGVAEQAERFGLSEVAYETTVRSKSGNEILMQKAMTLQVKERALLVGLRIGERLYEVASISNDLVTVVLKTKNPSIAIGDDVSLNNGLSDISVNFLAMHYSRLFSAGDPEHPSRLYWSQTPGDKRNIENWALDPASENTSGGHVDVGDNSSDCITGLCALSNQLLIFKQYSVYRLLGDRPSNFRIYRINAEVERCAHSSCILHNDVAYWMTKAGMYCHDGQNTQRLFHARKIQSFLAGAQTGNTKAAKKRDKLYFTAREPDGTPSPYDNAVIVYDLLRRAYMIRRGFTVADLFTSDGTIYMINGARYLYRFDEGPDYDGAPIDAYWYTPLTDLSSLYSVKCLKELYLRGVAQGDAAIDIDVQTDGHCANYRYHMPQRLHEVLEIPLKNEGRVFGLRFSNRNGSHWSIRGGLQLLYEPRLRTY